MDNILLIDFGSTYTKITAVDIEREMILGTARGITSVQTDITEGLQQAFSSLFAQTGRMEFSKTLACSSAAGGLKMVAIGLVPELTAEAARQAALGAGARLLAVYSHELSEYEMRNIATLKPDIILLAGGTDGGNKQVILHNAAMLRNLGIDTPVVVAGNKSVTPEVVRILEEKMTEVIPAANVMPKLNELAIEPARQAIRDVFLRKIVEAKGLNKAKELVDEMVMPTPAAVLKAAELLCTGTAQEPGWGELMVIDIGGATTDVYSIAKGDPTTNAVLRGLPEPFAKRTVEGDLGMRYSAAALLKAGGEALLSNYAGVTERQVNEYVEKVGCDVEYLPQDEAEQEIENAMGRACAKLGTDRHAGQIESHFSVLGQVFVQTGKDLTAIKTVIGTGGVIIANNSPGRILRGVVHEQALAEEVLKPKEPDFAVDREYIMSAMGLLGNEHPDIAVRMMKKYIVRGI